MPPRENLHIAVLHYPAYNKKKEVVATAVANMDIHDIARVARTYGMKRYYMVTPILSQRLFVERILAHWKTGAAAENYNPDRSEALKTVCIMETLEQVVDDIASRRGRRALTVATGAGLRENLISSADLARLLGEDRQEYLVLFGTGWGMTEEDIDRADYRLEPIMAGGDYNHLAVRSAVAIVVDRLNRGADI